MIMCDESEGNYSILVSLISRDSLALIGISVFLFIK